MKVKTKTTLIIVFTLITGMILGALLSRALLQNRVQRVFSMRSPNAFVQSYLETIKPDPGQEKQIKEILERNGQYMAEIRSKSREDLELAITAMTSELESVLTSEQIERLKSNSSRGRMPFGRRSPGDELVYLSTELELTNDQISQLKKIFEKFRMQPLDKEQRGTLKENSSTNRSQMENREKEIKKILTEEQSKQFDELMKNRRKRQPGRYRNLPL